MARINGLNELLGVTLPIIQAPMAGAQGSEMVIAVSEAGGLGSLPGAMLGADELRKELARIQAGTKKSYNANFFCHTQPKNDADREARWKKILAPYYAELGVPQTSSTGPGRASFGEEAAAILEEFRPPVISFHFGLPPDDLLTRVRATGAKILSSATTLEEALWLEKRGVDAVIAQGAEAGGHRGMFLTENLATQVGTRELVRQLVARVKVPVIAAGGIADGAGVSAMLKLGAVAAQIGTAYLLCPESTISAVYRKALESPSARQTAITNVFSGRPARGILNRAMRQLGPMSKDAPPFPLASAAMAPLRTQAESMGSGDFSPLWSGQDVSGCQAIPARELTLQLSGDCS